MAKYKYIIFLIVVFFCLNSFGQEIKNVRITQEGKTVVVLYDLTGKPGNYNVNLFYTLDDGKTWQGPLKNVNGDIAGQSTGINKKAIWNAAAEKGQIEGNIQFKLYAEINDQMGQTFNKQNVGYNAKQTYSHEYYKYKRSKNLWLGSALVSGGIGVFSMIQANNYYNQYPTATTSAADLYQKVKKVKLYDQVTSIAFGVAGLCTLEFIIKAGKQGKAKKQTISFLPQTINKGLGLGLVCKF